MTLGNKGNGTFSSTLWLEKGQEDVLLDLVKVYSCKGFLPPLGWYTTRGAVIKKIQGKP